MKCDILKWRAIHLLYGYKFDFTVLVVNFKYELRFAEIGINGEIGVLFHYT